MGPLDKTSVGLTKTPLFQYELTNLILAQLPQVLYPLTIIKARVLGPNAVSLSQLCLDISM